VQSRTGLSSEIRQSITEIILLFSFLLELGFCKSRLSFDTMLIKSGNEFTILNKTGYHLYGKKTVLKIN
jgi:hypothetical protein